MGHGSITYEWQCPLCGETGIGLSHGRGTPVADEAENALVTHVRGTDGDGHGKADELPAGFDPEALADNVRFKDRFGGRTAP